ncbi:MAG: 16S rRNA (cytidine(1402)-2'-O)-methyltransferase [Rhodobacteraceae bacterium]|nr:16S rRNA (cytidine(1402)-2'-O)-methyltransferase [Paracoccaceae bacterium]
MKGQHQPIAPGLYLVATPIGAARDITLRALDIFAAADILVAEDTRTLRHLLDIHGVAIGDRPLWAYHDHNGERARPKILAALKAGKSIAYASEAGTPLVADPGYQLGRAAIEAGHNVMSAPGASAVLTALCVSGLPSDRFLFAGFAPAAASARARWLKELTAIPATLVLYESPRRLRALLRTLEDDCGPDRQAVICRELTKKFEEVTRGTLAELRAAHEGRTVKGEIVVLLDRARAAAPNTDVVEDALREALVNMSIKDSAAMVAEALGLPRRRVYQIALGLAVDK